MLSLKLEQKVEKLLVENSLVRKLRAVANTKSL